jgi:uncharacterized protein (DUF2141 family)
MRLPQTYALAMVDWVVVSSLATAGGTLVLAIATFVSVRSANRAARTAERALQVGMRPLLSASRLTDPDLKMSWVDEHRARVGGGRASIEIVDDRIYLAMSLRNVGSGVAVMQAWNVSVDRDLANAPFGQPDEFRGQTRDLYVSTGDAGFWQAAIRDPEDPLYAGLRETIEQRHPLLIDILYTNDEGDQRAITRFVVVPPEDEGTHWFCSVGRHTYLDRPNPR